MLFKALTDFPDCTPPFEVYVYSDALADTNTISRGEMSDLVFQSLTPRSNISSSRLKINLGRQ